MFKYLLILIFPSILFSQVSDKPTHFDEVLKKYPDLNLNTKSNKAIIIKKGATVYADVGLQYPVHKLEVGEKIILADFNVRLENVYPILINGGVAYIEDKYIKIIKVNIPRSSPELRQHNVDYIFEEKISKLDGRINLLAKYSTLNAGNEWANFNKLAGDTARSIKGFQFLVEFQPKDEKYGFGIGPSYYSVSQNRIDMKTWAFEGQLNYTPVKVDFFHLDFHAGLGFSSGINLTVKDVAGVSTGYFYLWSLGTTLKFFPSYKYSPIVGFNFKSWKISNLNEVVFADDTTASLKGFTGTDFFVGLNYKF